MKILLYLNAQVGREDIFKSTIGNESLHETSNNNGVRVLNFATSKILSQKHDVPILQHLYINLDISIWGNPQSD
jgi:hypothetical protein